MSKPPLIAVMIGTGFGAGFWPWGPGTMGSVVATALWLLLCMLLPPAALLPATAVLMAVSTVLGTWATHRLMPFWGDDPSRVVVDEMAGMWVALLPAAQGHAPLLPLGCNGAHSAWTAAVAALVLFRFFDIVKPLGIRALDRRHGAFWVMADDLLAGAYSATVLLFI